MTHIAPALTVNTTTHLYQLVMFFGSSLFSRVTSHGEGLFSLVVSFSEGVVRTLPSASRSWPRKWSVVTVSEEWREAVMSEQERGKDEGYRG